MLCRTKARVQYHSDWCVAYVPDSIRNYFKLIPKYKCAQPQKYPPHITILRKTVERPAGNWGYRDGAMIDVSYDSCIQHNNLYYWLDAWSKDIQEIRVALGLPEFRFDRYHITVGNSKLAD